jgi:hypothetical protein
MSRTRKNKPAPQLRTPKEVASMTSWELLANIPDEWAAEATRFVGSRLGVADEHGAHRFMITSRSLSSTALLADEFESASLALAAAANIIRRSPPAAPVGEFVVEQLADITYQLSATPVQAAALALVHGQRSKLYEAPEDQLDDDDDDDDDNEVVVAPDKSSKPPWFDDDDDSQPVVTAISPGGDQ